MKTEQILSALKLTRSKETQNFCSKLFTLYTFLLLIKGSIIKTYVALISYTINKNGKEMDMPQIRMDYINHLVWEYTNNDKAIKELDARLRINYGNLHSNKAILWKKRKNKNNSELETEISNIQTIIIECEAKRTELIELERTRVNGLEYHIWDMREALQLFEGRKITVTTKTGEYTFLLPIDNSFYYLICDMLKLEYEVKGITKTDKKEVVKILPFNMVNVMEGIRKAAKFVSTDDLRPAMTCVCLDFDKRLQIVATDAHRLYYSNTIDVQLGYNDIPAKTFKPFQLLISPESVKQLLKSKEVKSEIYITVFNDNTALINGIEVKLFDAKFPDYKVVIPEYENYMQFDREDFKDTVKTVLPYTNKSTSQVTFHLNGDITLNAQDVDFDFESNARMNYISKNFPDTDIAFNGKFLVEIMGIFKKETVKMFTDGIPTKGAIFTDDKDNVLVMPLMIKDRW